ncbi:MAG: AAA family ATPase [Candidatus Pacearchaeota archaeon]|jgi:exonuclease SbcC
MIIKKVILENIRSYENEEIVFPEGSTLLSGDIGCGKTSILLAIEFALFGLQPGQRGSFLLRNGKNEGRVIMDFVVEENEITVERTLKRGKSISQEYASITINGEKKELSVTELKSKILELLDYSKEFAKKQNLLYKFTVYTPQEEMKQIILQDAETRINTLRHVFGVDKYKKVLENISVVSLKLREEKKVKEAMISNLEEDKLNLISREKEIEQMKFNLVGLTKELSFRIDKRKRIEKEKEETFSKVEEKSNFSREIEKTRIMILSKRDSFNNNQKLIVNLKKEIAEFEKFQFDNSKIMELEKEISLLKKSEEKLDLERVEIIGELANLNLKNEELDSLHRKMSNLDVCPTCLQTVDSVYRSNVLNKTHNDISKNKNKIEELNLKKQEIFSKIREIDYQTHLKEKDLTELKIQKMRLESLKDKKIRLEELNNLNIDFEKDISFLENHLQELNNVVLSFSKYEKIYELKINELSEALREERLFDIKVAELKKEIELSIRQIEFIKERIQKTQETKSQLDYITELENWISKKFVPLVSFIEKNVMITLRNEFSNLLKEWFSMLVSDNFNVRLDENFTPIIEQQDYELDYSYLSGGERTAIALAYRLALNQVINSLMSKIKTKDLVILDEPTDGFSDTQLDKMREVLDQLKIKQLIIVSHEQKIEGFVENVIKFKKENQVSKRVV